MDIKVGIIMGSQSDMGIMQDAAQVLTQLGVGFEITVVSAHRTPERMFTYARTAATRGLKVIIAGAGGAAHLPGMVASITPLPVIGVPIKSSNSIDGWDSILSILQMPNGVPVATVALNGAKNAGILAAQILACADAQLLANVIAFKEELRRKVEEHLM
ncbi:MAG: 5-(carboxyamino)imidazole ribonucleotide mutase [Sphingobacteriales bacterium]|nr:MAG: 5-(carboxyamino)imidazole ribonucleotide mutase [Sphingobacteriales bacterium]TAF78920.1 MAG: 5-(carboxyamino)imidazole ribonucleotide mutase [Sphingobacteriales bacterium]